MIVIDDLKVYTIEECAQLLKVSTTTARRYARQGKILSQKVGGKTYVTEDTIKSFLKGENLNND